MSMGTFRWSAVMSLIGALLFLIGTAFHPLLTNPWNTTYAFQEMAHHNHWVLDHWTFFIGLTLWLTGLAHLADLYSSSNERESSGGRSAARCFIGSLVMWMLILTVEIAVLPPLTHLVNVNNDLIAGEIWDTLFTWGLFAGYLDMGLVYFGIIFLSFPNEGWLSILAKVVGVIGILGVIWSLILPNTALVIQLMTAPLPFIWTIWYSFRLMKI